MKKVRTFSLLLAIALLVTPCYAGKPTTRTSSGVKVYDATGKLLGILAHLAPVPLNPADEIAPGLTVFVPSVGKFFEMRWNESDQTLRTGPNALYFDGPGCTGNIYTDRLSIPAASGQIIVMYNEYYLYEFKDENQDYAFYTIGQPPGVNPDQIQSRKERGKPCEAFIYPSGFSVNFWPLTQAVVDIPFPFVPPLRFE